MSAEAGFDPMAVVRAFNRHGVDYVVIGGFAAELHQAPVEPTRDIDFTPSTTEENLGRLSAALSDLGARIRTDAEPERLAFSSLRVSVDGRYSDDEGEFRRRSGAGRPCTC